MQTINTIWSVRTATFMMVTRCWRCVVFIIVLWDKKYPTNLNMFCHITSLAIWWVSVWVLFCFLVLKAQYLSNLSKNAASNFTVHLEEVRNTKNKTSWAQQYLNCKSFTFIVFQATSFLENKAKARLKCYQVIISWFYFLQQWTM